MLSDAATLGALFLLVVLVPPWASGANLSAIRAPDQAAMALAGLGVGALIRLASSVIWNAAFHYARPGTWRHNAAARSVATAAVVSTIASDEGQADMLTTSYELYTQADPQLTDWIRRRHGGFATDLNAATAIGLGCAVTLVVALPFLTVLGWLLWLLFVALAAATFVSGFLKRTEAEQMEQLWHTFHPPH